MAREIWKPLTCPRRLDVEFALQTGSRLRFVDKDAPHAGLPTDPCLHEETIATGAFFQLQNTLTDLAAVAVKVERFSRLLNDVREGRKLSQLQFSQHTNHLIHRLLVAIPLNSCDDLARLDKMLYLGQLVLLVTLLNDYGSHHSRYDMLASLLRATIRHFIPLTASEEVFFLCVSLFAGISILQPDDDDWLLPSVETRCRSLGLETWEQLSLKLGTLPLVQVLHGDPGRKLFETARRTCGNSEKAGAVPGGDNLSVGEMVEIRKTPELKVRIALDRNKISSMIGCKEINTGHPFCRSLDEVTKSTTRAYGHVLTPAQDTWLLLLISSGLR
jgi:hypothetical protein